MAGRQLFGGVKFLIRYFVVLHMQESSSSNFEACEDLDPNPKEISHIRPRDSRTSRHLAFYVVLSIDP